MEYFQFPNALLAMNSAGRDGESKLWRAVPETYSLDTIILALRKLNVN
jgi:hypothetical protein